MRTERKSPLSVGEPAPWFMARTRSNPRYVFNSVGGRYVVLSFLESAGAPAPGRLLECVQANRARFDDQNLCFFGVTADPADEALGRIADSIPGIRYFFDLDRSVSAMYGALGSGDAYRRLTYVVDPLLRVVAVIPLTDDVEGHMTRIFEALDSCPPIGPAYAAMLQAPVLVLPRVFEPRLCRSL